jgi:hypothetical protein
MVSSAGGEYPFYQGDCHHWWNRFPSATASKPERCLAFKENTAPIYHPPSETYSNPESCDGRDNGPQHVRVNGKDRKVNCYNGWIIMRTDLDAGWLSDTYFTGFGKYSTNSGAVYGPSHSLIMQSNMDATRTSGWFTKSGITFGTSDDCATMTTTNNNGYYATGNYMPSPTRGRCVYWNRNCDETSDGTCHQCNDNYNGGRMTHGTCSHMTQSASSEYPFYQGDCHHWWNRFPSVTAEKPTHCLAFRNNN